METLLAIGAAVTVIGAVAAIIYRVTVGDPEKARLEKLKDELVRGASSSGDSKKK